jgi:hypothetical protein
LLHAHRDVSLLFTQRRGAARHGETSTPATCPIAVVYHNPNREGFDGRRSELVDLMHAEVDGNQDRARAEGSAVCV